MKMPSARTVILLAWATLVAWLPQADAGQWVRPNQLNLRDTRGNPIVWVPAELTVFCFLGTECPLAKLYGPRLQRLADEFADRGVRFVGVNSNVQDSPAEIDDYATKHSIRFPIAKDANQSAAEMLGATRTPEVVVVSPLGKIVYQGRIDDQYEPGLAKPEPTKNDLHDAIEKTLAGKVLVHSRTQGVGCLISRIKQPNRAGEAKPAVEVTFTRDIAPILNQHCVECHREGEIGPFALTEYDEVVGWGAMMLEVIDQKRMPPWHADPKIGHFIGERRFPAEAREAIAAWIDQGMPEGDPAELPQQPTRLSGWHLKTQPDVQLKMRERPFRVPAEGVVEYQHFVVVPDWTEDRWVRAAQVIPGDASVVHHCIVFVRPPGESDSGGVGWLGAYVPGQRTMMLPPGHGRLVPAGSTLVFQMHYTPNGTACEDTTKVGIWFADAESITHEVATQLAVNHEFRIPPGKSDYEVKMSRQRFPDQARMLGATPHMHLRGKSFLMSATKVSGDCQTLLHVPAYDFNWQHWYAFSKPIDLDEVDSLEMKITFDNSRNNPVNPDPDQYVTWGDQTWEEMALVFFDVACPVGHWPAKSRRGSQLNIIPSEKELAARQQKIDQRVQAYLLKLDRDGDGAIGREEAPTKFRRDGFDDADYDHDGQLCRDEILAAVEAGQ
jgi:thiol-disulfide isomerase/thioredoxin